MFIVTESIRIKPLTNAVIPTITFNFQTKTNDLELVTGISGVLLSEDEKVLSYLIESDPLTSNAQEQAIGELGATRTHLDDVLSKMKDRHIKMIAILNKKTIDYIDEVRNRNPKKDVVFKIRIKTKKLVSNAVVAHINTKLPEEYTLTPKAGERLLTYEHTTRFSADENNLWIISGDGSPKFLQAKELIEEVKVIIPSSDWIHDFAPQFGIGKFLVVEMPIIMPDLQPGNEFEKRIDEAIKALPKMEEKIKEGEWNEVIEKARPVLELIKSKDELKPILIKSGYTEEAAEDFLVGIQAFFDYSSKFIHRVGKHPSRQLMGEISSEKEDAYLIYSLATSLVNLLSRKISKTK